MRKILIVLLAVALWLFGSACGKVYEAEELPNAFRLPAGAEIFVKPTQAIDVAALKDGDAFAGVLAKPLFYIREAVAPDGDTFERTTLAAPEGAPVRGVFVAKDGATAGQSALGLKLTEIVFHGGKSFPVETEPLYALGPAAQNQELAFKLSKPADVALVIELRAAEDVESSL